METVNIENLKILKRLEIITQKDYINYIMKYAKYYVENDMKLEVVRVGKKTSSGGLLSAKEHGGTLIRSINVIIAEKCVGHETDIWPTLQHPNILCLMNMQYIPQIDSHIFITQHYPCSLRRYLRSRDFAKNKEALNEAKRFLRGILEGIVYLHDKSFSHLNISTKNVLLSESHQVVIAELKSMGSVAEISKE